MTTTLQKQATETTQPERTRAGYAYRPNVDILEKGEELLLVADVPGARAEDINIEYENGVLTLNARVPARGAAEQADCVQCEYGVGDFVRTFQIGEGVDSGRISAEVSNGVLTLHLPKTAAARTRKIDVRTA